MKYSNSKLTFLNGIPDSDCHKFDMNHIVITGKTHSGKTYWALRTLLDLVATQPFPTERKRVLLHAGEHHTLHLVEILGDMLKDYGYSSFKSISEDKLADLRYIQTYLTSILDFFKKYNYDIVTTNDATVFAERLTMDDSKDLAFIVSDHHPIAFDTIINEVAKRNGTTLITTRNINRHEIARRISSVTENAQPPIVVNVELNIDTGTATNAVYPLSISSSRKLAESIDDISMDIGKQIKERAERAKTNIIKEGHSS